MASKASSQSEVEGLREVIRLIRQSLDLCKKALRDAEQTAGSPIQDNDPPSNE